MWLSGGELIDWLSMVLRLRQHNISYTADGFYRSDDPTNSVKALKEGGWNAIDETLSHFDTILDCDRQTDRQTDNLWQQRRAMHNIIQYKYATKKPCVNVHWAHWSCSLTLGGNNSTPYDKAPSVQE